MLLGNELQSCAHSLNTQHSTALQAIKEKNKKQISKPNREIITLLSAACDIS